MGNTLKTKKQSRCICVGLDNSGKSTILNKLKPESKKAPETFPTVGFQVEKFTHSNVHFTVYDMSGSGRYRNLWEHYYQETEGIIFVVDSADPVRLCVVKDELDILLAHKDIAKRKNIPVLFLANKMDLPKALTTAQISEGLELHKMEREYNIIATNALTGQGLEEAMKWLSAHLDK